MGEESYSCKATQLVRTYDTKSMPASGLAIVHQISDAVQDKMIR